MWSALESLSDLTGGKYNRCAFYDAKAKITDYLVKSGQKYVIVQPACYFANLLVSRLQGRKRRPRRSSPSPKPSTVSPADTLPSLQQGLYAPRLDPTTANTSTPTYVLSLPSSPKSTMAWFDAATDYGLYVRVVLEGPGGIEGAHGVEVLCGSETSFEEVVQVFSRGELRVCCGPRSGDDERVHAHSERQEGCLQAGGRAGVQ